MKGLGLIVMLCVALALAIGGCGDDDSTANTAGSAETASEQYDSNVSTDMEAKPEVEVPEVAPPKKLVELEIVEGDGPTAEAGDKVSVEFVGVGYESGKEFDTTWGGDPKPFTFELGVEEVIPGWDKGVKGMKVGGRRELIIPPELAFGDGGPGAIGPNETLIYIIDLLAVKK